MPRHAVFDDSFLRPSNLRTRRVRSAPRTQNFDHPIGKHETAVPKASKWEEHFSETNYRNKRPVAATSSFSGVKQDMYEQRENGGVIRATADAMLGIRPSLVLGYAFKDEEKEGGERHKPQHGASAPNAAITMSVRKSDNNNTSTKHHSSTAAHEAVRESEEPDEERADATLLHFLDEADNPRSASPGTSAMQGYITNVGDERGWGRFEMELARARALLESKHLSTERSASQTEYISRSSQEPSFAEAVLGSLGRCVAPAAVPSDSDIYGVLGLARRRLIAFPTEERRRDQDDESIPATAQGGEERRRDQDDESIPATAEGSTPLQRVESRAEPLNRKEEIRGNGRNVLDELLSYVKVPSRPHQNSLRPFQTSRTESELVFAAKPVLSSKGSLVEFSTLMSQEEMLHSARRSEELVNAQHSTRSRDNKSEHSGDSEFSFDNPDEAQVFPLSVEEANVNSSFEKYNEDDHKSNEEHISVVMYQEVGAPAMLTSEPTNSNRIEDENRFFAALSHLTQHGTVLLAVEESSARSILIAAEAVAYESLTSRFVFTSEQLQRDAVRFGEFVAALERVRTAKADNIAGPALFQTTEETFENKRDGEDDNEVVLSSSLVVQLASDVASHAKTEVETHQKNMKEVRSLRVYETIREASMAAVSEVMKTVVPRDDDVAEFESLALEATRAAVHESRDRFQGESEAKEKLLSLLTRVATQAASDAVTINMSQHIESRTALIESLDSDEQQVTAVVDGAVQKFKEQLTERTQKREVLLRESSLEHLETADALEIEDDVAEPLAIEEDISAIIPGSAMKGEASASPARQPARRSTVVQGDQTRKRRGNNVGDKLEKPYSEHRAPFMYFEEECFDSLVPSPAKGSPHGGLRRFLSQKRANAIAEKRDFATETHKDVAIDVSEVLPQTPRVDPEDPQTKIHWGSSGQPFLNPVSFEEQQPREVRRSEIEFPRPDVSTSFSPRSPTPDPPKPVTKVALLSDRSELNQIPTKPYFREERPVGQGSSQQSLVQPRQQFSLDVSLRDSEGNVRRLKAQLDELRLRSRTRV